MSICAILCFCNARCIMEELRTCPRCHQAHHGNGLVTHMRKTHSIRFGVSALNALGDLDKHILKYVQIQSADHPFWPKDLLELKQKIALAIKVVHSEIPDMNPIKHHAITFLINWRLGHLVVPHLPNQVLPPRHSLASSAAHPPPQCNNEELAVAEILISMREARET